MTHVITCRDLVRGYGRTRVLDGVSFSVQEGEVIGLLGRNGTGKTTLVRLLMGMLAPHAGAVSVFGRSPFHEPVAVRRRIGFVAEDQPLPPTWRVQEVVALHQRLFPSWDHVLAESLRARFGLDGRAPLRTLSNGQRRQVALLCAVAHRPELLLLDEPAGGLDPVARREFLETTIQLLNTHGTTVLLSSHQLADVERLGGRVLLLDDGRVRVDASVDALRESHSVAVVPRSARIRDVLVDEALLRALPDVIGVRTMEHAWHVVFAIAPRDAVVHLHARGLFGVTCAAVPLEELFIALTGAERAPVPT
jgi:ABC-2 type transport system ATP-binding protein